MRDSAYSRGDQGVLATPEEPLIGDLSDAEHMSQQERDAGEFTGGSGESTDPAGRRVQRLRALNGAIQDGVTWRGCRATAVRGGVVGDGKHWMWQSKPTLDSALQPRDSQVGSTATIVVGVKSSAAPGTKYFGDSRTTRRCCP